MDLSNGFVGRLSRCRTRAEVLELCDDFDEARREFFFDRHPASFGAVINFFRTGQLHASEDLCVMSFAADLEYWGIDEVRCASFTRISAL